jgi:hypothetical protein
MLANSNRSAEELDILSGQSGTMLRCTRKPTGFETDEVAWRFVPDGDAGGTYPASSESGAAAVAYLRTF